MDPAGRSLKNQMKQAGKTNARFTFILGEDELANNSAILRNMESKEQQAIPLSDTGADCCQKIVESIK